MTYKVVNGTWSDGATAGKTEIVVSGAKPADVPVGMIASSGYDVSKSASLDKFSDAGSVADYALDAMRWAVGMGLISGTDTGKLDPTGSATRAQVAAIMTRFVRNVK